MRTDADLSMHGISRLVAEVMERLDLRPVDKRDTLQAAERLRSFERPARRTLPRHPRFRQRHSMTLTPRRSR
jgi:hypothetical protein